MQKFHRPLLLALGSALYQIFSENRYADKVIEKTLKMNSKWGSRDRKFFAESVYEVVRHYRKLHFLQGEPALASPQDYLNLWGVYAYEKWQTQDLLGVEFDIEVYQARLKELGAASQALQSSWSEWLYDHAHQELGPAWLPMAEALNQVAPVDLRVNRLKTTVPDLKAKLLSEEIETHEISLAVDGLSLFERKNVFVTQAFKQGLFEVQDRSSQQVAALLGPKPGDRVCDACAGAGGKSLHIAALMGNKGRIVAMDVVDWKLAELKKRASRAGVSIIEPRLIESSKTIKRQEGKFDRLLLDVPCTGLGVIRRNPDTKWKLTPERIAELTTLQSEILQSYSRMVRPGGMMVYATCSVLPSENEKQIEAFMTRNGDKWSWVSSWWSRLNPDEGDGFFAAKLERKAD